MASQQPQTSHDPLSIITNIFDNLTTTNKNILDQQENDAVLHINKLDILYNIITILADDSPLINSINELLSNSGNFSDFDYNLLPNKNPTFDTSQTGEFIQRLDAAIPSDTKDQGFALFRIKSFISCTDPGLEK